MVLKISLFLRRLSDFLSKFRLFLSLKLRILLSFIKFILIDVFPSLSNIFEISFTSSSDLTSKKTSLIGLLKRSFNDPIFWTFTRLYLFSSLEILLTKVKIKELPSFNISRFSSKISENIKSSKTLDKSVNFNTA